LLWLHTPGPACPGRKKGFRPRVGSNHQPFG